MKENKNELTRLINLGHNELLTLKKDLGTGKELIQTIQEKNHNNDLIELSLIAFLGFLIGAKALYYFLFERKKQASEEIKRSHERKSFRRLKRRFYESIRGAFRTKDRQVNAAERANHPRAETEDEMSEDDQSN